MDNKHEPIEEECREAIDYWLKHYVVPAIIYKEPYALTISNISPGKLELHMLGSTQNPWSFEVTIKCGWHINMSKMFYSHINIRGTDIKQYIERRIREMMTQPSQDEYRDMLIDLMKKNEERVMKRIDELQQQVCELTKVAKELSR